MSLTEVIELDKKQKTEMINKPVKATERDKTAQKKDDPKSGLKTIKWPEKWPEKCQLILDSINEDENITISKLENMLNVGHTTVKKMLAEMQQEGFIRRIGADKGGHWEIVYAKMCKND